MNDAVLVSGRILTCTGFVVAVVGASWAVLVGLLVGPEVVGLLAARVVVGVGSSLGIKSASRFTSR